MICFVHVIAQGTGSHFDMGATSWRHTRSLFTAMEEMQKLAAQEEAEREAEQQAGKQSENVHGRQ